VVVVATGVVVGSGWAGSMCWAVWLKKRTAAGAMIVVVVGRSAGARRVTGARSSSTERSNALLMAGLVWLSVFPSNWVGDVRVVGRRGAVSAGWLRDGLGVGSCVENSVERAPEVGRSPGENYVGLWCMQGFTSVSR
jgi:hypothetical protein